MVKKIVTMIGISAAGIQAPSVNFDTTTMPAIRPVVTTPTALITRLIFQRGSFSLMWCITMPDWLRVKPVNTPNAYKGMERRCRP